MILSKRLNAVAGMVSEGMRLADIGTDHAFVPIYLVESGRIPCAIAMDVNRGPLERAIEHIKAHGLSDQIAARLSDGLDQLGRDEADTVLIAGMGGALTVRILQQRPQLCGEIKELVLQPQSEVDLVRRYLQDSGWNIEEEQMVCEDGKYYPMMRCMSGKMTLTDEQALYGPCLMKKADPVWISFLRWREGILQKNLSQLVNSDSDRGRARSDEVKQQLEVLRNLLSEHAGELRSFCIKAQAEQHLLSEHAGE